MNTPTSKQTLDQCLLILDHTRDKIDLLENKLLDLCKNYLDTKARQNEEAEALVAEIDRLRSIAALLEDSNHLPDDWRYCPVGDSTWILDRASTNPEDELIADIDDQEILPKRISGIEMLSRISSKRATIIYMHVWEGMSFRAIGEHFGITKQAAHQHYKNGIQELRRQFPNLASLTPSTL